MIAIPKKKIVVLGLMSHIPVAGAAWLTVQYLIGFQRLGFDVYYVEAHGIQPAGMLVQQASADSSARAVEYIAGIMKRFDLEHHWAFHALHTDGRYYGMTETEVKELYRSAALIINLHGGTVPLPEHAATGRLIYLGTDPVELEIELYHERQETIDFLAPHRAFFTWGLNYGNPDCRMPVAERFHLQPSPPPVVVDLWQADRNGAGDTFTTIGNWRQAHRQVEFKGEIYHWSKHLEFLKFIDLPGRTRQSFELALSSYQEADQRLLERKGWKVRDALSFSTDLDAYRQYIGRARGEFTVAKDQNVRLRSGWFSERSAQYLAAGKPVITQETGFSNILPTARGLFGFSTLEEIVEAVESINANYEQHCRAASELAREFFNYDVVLPRLLSAMGL
jgi:hypothetical protein